MIETDLVSKANEIQAAGEFYNSLFVLNLNVPYSTLKIESFDDFLDYHYYSDHHWTYKGIYQGYLDILNLIFGSEDNALRPWGENCFDDLRFYGTTSTITGRVTEPAPFCVYGYELPAYTLYYSNQEFTYHFDTNNFYFSGSRGEESYHYNDAYRLVDGPHTLIELVSTSGSNQENILIVGDSYAPPLLPLLANHFSHIYFLNQVVFEQVEQEKFYYDSFIKEQKIKNILFTYIIDNYIVHDEWGPRYLGFAVNRD